MNIYEKQAQFNRGTPAPVLEFSSLPSKEAQEIRDYIQKEATVLEKESIHKQASASPFDMFGNAKMYLRNRLGVSDETAHDIAGSVMGKAQQIQENHGGELVQIAQGIIDEMEPGQFEESRLKYRIMSAQEQEAFAKNLLMEQMNASAYEADRYKKSIVNSARTLYTKHRTKTPQEIIKAIVDVIAERRDITLVFDVPSDDHLKREIEMRLTTY